MTETFDWIAARKRYERFLQTELGQLYYAYDKATIDKYAAKEDISHKELEELNQKAREATNAFVVKLMELAGV